MDFLGDVRVTVEHKGGGVRVGAHVLEDQPVADLGARKFGLVLVADLVQAVAGGSENSGWDLVVALGSVNFRVNHLGQNEGNGLVVVVYDVVEGAVDTVVDVERLGVAFAALTSVDLGRDRGRAADEVPAGLRDKPELAFISDFELELADCVAHGLCDGWESGCVVAVGSHVVTRETAATVDHGHLGHAKGVGGLEQTSSVVERGAVGAWVPAA